MATPKHGKAHRVYYDHMPVSAFANSDSLELSADAAEHTAFESAAKEHLAGKYSGTSNFAGFLDVADAGFGDVQHADLADGEHWIARLFNGTGIGSLAYETVEVSTGNSIAADVANVVAMTWNGQGADRFGRGCQLTAGAASITASGALAGTNYGSVWGTVGASSVQVVTARVVAVDGSGSISIQLEESSDDGSADAYAQVTGWTSTEIDPGTNVNIATADTLTFTGVGSAKMTRTGAIETWQRVNVSAYSTFTSVTLLVTTVTLA